jgi:hypothetical protein
MSSDNPYAPPLLPAERMELPWPENGVYRDRKFIVKHWSTPLPPYCIKTGEPTERTEMLELAAEASDGSVAATRRWPLNLVRFYRIATPISLAWTKRIELPRFIGRILQVVGSLVLIAGTVMLLALETDPRQVRSYYVAVVLTGGAGGIILATGTFFSTFGWVKLRRIRRGFLWLDGAGSNYLNLLERWPV